MAAIRGQSEYEAILHPVVLGREVRGAVPGRHAVQLMSGWTADGARADVGATVLGVHGEHQVRAAGLGSVDQPCLEFKQEYLATFDEAFQSSGASFIPAVLVMKGAQPASRSRWAVGRSSWASIRRATVTGSASSIAAVRVAGERISEAWLPQGDTGFPGAAHRRGDHSRLMPDAVNIDIGGVGPVVDDTLRDKGYANPATP